MILNNVNVFLNFHIEAFAIISQRTPHKINGKELSVKLSETLGFGSSKRVEQMSQWEQRPDMDRCRDIRAASDEKLHC